MVFVVLAMLPGAVQAQEDGFTQALIAEAYETHTPAMCILNYTLEITAAGTGEISRRATRALGLIVSPDGLVMTHGHMLIEDAQPANIRCVVGYGAGEEEYEAVLLKKPDDVNVCFLRIVSEEPLDLPHIAFARGVELGIGEPVLLIGLFSEALDYARAVHTARVGAILDKPRKTYCLDEKVRYGFVSAPVINRHGQVIGVLGFDLKAEEGGELYVRSGHPLVYQSALFTHYIDTPPTRETLPEKQEDAWLGIFTQPLTEDFAAYWNIQEPGGIIVSTVVPGSPAETAGLAMGDVIVQFDGNPVRPKQDREVVQFSKLIRETGVGKTVEIKYLRDAVPMSCTVILAPRPKTAAAAEEYEDAVFGMTVRELTTDVRILLNLPESVQGVIVRRIRSGSVADAAGVQPGAVIMNFGDHAVTSIADFEAAVGAVVETRPGEVPVFCRVGPATGFYRLEPRWGE